MGKDARGRGGVRKGGEMRSLEALGQPRHWDCSGIGTAQPRLVDSTAAGDFGEFNIPGLKEEKIFTPNYLGLYPP